MFSIDVNSLVSLISMIQESAVEISHTVHYILAVSIAVYIVCQPTQAVVMC